MRIAFYAPLKPPTHATPSGDRRVAGLLMEALVRAGQRVELVSTFRSFDGDGDAGRQTALRSQGESLARRMAAQWQAAPREQRPDLWFTYHLYYKAPDWLGPAISAALDLRAQLGRDTEKIERVELVIGPQAHDVVGRDVPEKRVPQTRVNAQFSVYWCVASALAYGEVTPRQLAEEIPPSPKLREWIGKISATPDPAAAQRDIGGCKLRAHGAFGTRAVKQTSAKGHPDNPLNDDELLAKFKANLRYAKVSDETAAQLADAIMDIDSLSEVRPLADAIAGVVA